MSVILSVWQIRNFFKKMKQEKIKKQINFIYTFIHWNMQILFVTLFICYTHFSWENEKNYLKNYIFNFWICAFYLPGIVDIRWRKWRKRDKTANVWYFKMLEYANIRAILSVWNTLKNFNENRMREIKKCYTFSNFIICKFCLL